MRRRRSICTRVVGLERGPPGGLGPDDQLGHGSQGAVAVAAGAGGQAEEADHVRLAEPQHRRGGCDVVVHAHVIEGHLQRRVHDGRRDPVGALALDQPQAVSPMHAALNLLRQARLAHGGAGAGAGEERWSPYGHVGGVERPAPGPTRENRASTSSGVQVDVSK